MHIGLIGGIGPAATIAYYDLMVRRFREADQTLELTIVHADVAPLMTNSKSDNRAAQAKIFAGHIDQLKGAGCDVATITALTGHFCLEETRAIATLPIISAIEPIDQHCQQKGIKTIGLLGSPPVLSSHLFGQMELTNTVVPDGGSEKLGTAYFEMATSGTCSEETRKMFFDAGNEMVKNRGADAILLAGTDLGLAFNGHDPGYPVIDALSVHVEALLELAQQ